MTNSFSFTQHFMPITIHGEHIYWTDVSTSVGGTVALIRSLKTATPRNLTSLPFKNLLHSVADSSMELLRYAEQELVVDLLVIDTQEQPSSFCIPYSILDFLPLLLHLFPYLLIYFYRWKFSIKKYLTFPSDDKLLSV